MADKVIILKNTDKGLVVDTIYNSTDTLWLSVKGETVISLPDKPIEVSLPNKSKAESFGIYVGLIGGVIAASVALITLWKLVKKDKKREAEIASLTTIAEQLTNMQKESEKRYKNTKKPLIDIEINHLKNNSVTIKFTNSNIHSTIIGFEIPNKPLLGFFSMTKTTINQTGNSQFFSVFLSYRDIAPDFFTLPIEYITEEGYKFFQEVSFQLEKSQYLQIPSVIINSEDKKE